ncbi:MAG: efflux RND transporter periplasmic adaptor subunit [Candidatus Omnitrophica bacterium]|nr:efflux RND transporter periplasmic adaptor subunit [Candidatus Omnitrophota bacterium]
MKIKVNKRMEFYVILIMGLLVLFCVNMSYAAEGKKSRKIIYYRNPMNPSITSDFPAKDNMGMDYIPVYEEDKTPESSAGTQHQGAVHLTQRDVSLAGIVSQPVSAMQLFKDIRTVGRVAYDPELYKTEEEFIQALKAKKSLERSQIDEVRERADALVEAADLKLRLLGLSQEQIDDLKLKGKPDRSLIISDKDTPYVWVYADIYEYELSWIRVGQPVKINIVSFPDEEFKGSIVAVDSNLDPVTRSVRIRARIENLQLKLKPQMYADIYIEAYLVNEKGEHGISLAIPEDALLDTGMRKLVYLDLGNGSYLGKEVQVGPMACAYANGQKMNFYPVFSGVNKGDRVVIKANFLIDSQSQISDVASSAYSGAIGSSGK